MMFKLKKLNMIFYSRNGQGSIVINLCVLPYIKTMALRDRMTFGSSHPTLQERGTALSLNWLILFYPKTICF